MSDASKSGMWRWILWMPYSVTCAVWRFVVHGWTKLVGAGLKLRLRWLSWRDARFRRKHIFRLLRELDSDEIEKQLRTVPDDHFPFALQIVGDDPRAQVIRGEFERRCRERVAKLSKGREQR